MTNNINSHVEPTPLDFARSLPSDMSDSDAMTSMVRFMEAETMEVKAMPIGTPSRGDILLFVEIPIVLVALACIGAGIWWWLS